jgi:hypothetical protein
MDKKVLFLNSAKFKNIIKEIKHIILILIVNVRNDGSNKLNACISFLSHMVYLQPKHNVH